MLQTEALAILKDGRNVFLTGEAGSGKTHVLNQFIKHLRAKGKSVGITASTGIAATHISGVTIHSWAGFGIRDELTEYDIDAMSQREKLVKKYAATDTLVIDEVSMLHAHQLDFIDRIARALRQSDEPFGGMQVVLCGDLFQLPPVGKGGEARFVTHSTVWSRSDLSICYLSEQYRQGDATLLSVLNDIRNNRVDEETKVPLRDRYRQPIESGLTPTRLYTHNMDVDRINDRELDRIDAPPKIYEMVTRGAKKKVEGLINSCLAPEKLRLKKGAVVMFVKNSQDRRYVNGTMGVVEDFDKDTGLPVVQTYDGRTILAQQESWRIEDDGKVKAEIAQVPLRLAWAITVHKSQGMSLDAAEVDLSKSFTPGMGYVALSRVRTLAGLSLTGMNEMGFRVHDMVLEVDEELKAASDSLVERAQVLIEEQGIDDSQIGEPGVNVGKPVGLSPIESDDQPSDLRRKGYNIIEIRKHFHKAYLKWTKEEEAELTKLFVDKPDTSRSSLKKLAAHFGRGHGAIHSRLVTLGLIEE